MVASLRFLVDDAGPTIPDTPHVRRFDRAAIVVDEVPVVPGHAPPPLDALDTIEHDGVFASALGVLLDHIERGHAGDDALLRLCMRPEALDDIVARDAQRAIDRLARKPRNENAARDRAIVNVLAA